MARLSVEAGVAGAGCLRRRLYGRFHHLQVMLEKDVVFTQVF
jgi:hypothetical protein